MKQSETWITEKQQVFTYGTHWQLCQLIEEIQRDAWRQGLTDAAAISKDAFGDVRDYSAAITKLIEQTRDAIK